MLPAGAESFRHSTTTGALGSTSPQTAWSALKWKARLNGPVSSDRERLTEPMSESAAVRTFDPTRAHLSATDDFPPFNVEPADERPLRDVLAANEIPPDTELVITERRPASASGGAPPTPLAFVVRQLAFHHVAQGETAGEPWMVSF
jgi:hypothetical protein